MPVTRVSQVLLLAWWIMIEGIWRHRLDQPLKALFCLYTENAGLAQDIALSHLLLGKARNDDGEEEVSAW